MLMQLRRRLRSFSTILAALLTSVWLAAALAPCAMASECPKHAAMPDMNAMPNCDMPAGDPAMLDCDLPPANTPVAMTPDFTFVPALLALVPAMIVAPPPPETWAVAAQPAAPPPLPAYLVNLALLI